MKSILVAFTILSLATSAAVAGDDTDTECTKLSNNAWSCPLPAYHWDEPPMCHIYGDQQICTRPLRTAPEPTYTKPSNCGRNRAGIYRCW